MGRDYHDRPQNVSGCLSYEIKYSNQISGQEEIPRPTLAGEIMLRYLVWNGLTALLFIIQRENTSSFMGLSYYFTF